MCGPEAAAVLALYTDGLVESRTRSFDQGIVALRSALAREHGNLDAICDALIASLAGRCEDDITVVLAHPAEPPQLTGVLAEMYPQRRRHLYSSRHGDATPAGV